MDIDLVISNGLVVDGTGAAPRNADVAIVGERIVGVGDVGSFPDAARTFDATGLVVTPGWVDIHTHYDGQATWDPDLAPSSANGVTSIVMGNCGVGFAPARPDRSARSRSGRPATCSRQSAYRGSDLHPCDPRSQSRYAASQSDLDAKARGLSDH